MKRSFFIASWVFFGLIVLGEHGSQKPLSTQVSNEGWSLSPSSSHNTGDLSQQVAGLLNQGYLADFFGKAQQWGQEIVRNNSLAAYWHGKAAELGRLNAISKLKQMNPLGQQKPTKEPVVTETNDVYRVVTEDGKLFEIKGNIPNLKNEMSESRLSTPDYDCEIKPVMTDEEIRKCRK